MLVWVVIYTYSQTSLPVVRLQYTDISNDTFSYGTFEFIDGDDTVSLNCEIRHRGSSATRYTKKSYAVKLLDDNNQKNDTSFLGMRSDNYWILDAMAVDKARMRNRVAMDLWLDFSTKPYYQNMEPKMCNGYKGKFVEVYVNESYNGLYCLMERVDRKQLKLKKAKTNAINGVLYKSVSWAGGFFDDLSPYDNTSYMWMRYEYKYPDEEVGLITWKPLYDAMDFVATASADEFLKEADLRYDIPVFMDYYLFTTVLSALDNCGKNLYLSFYNINQESKLLITPWDIDHSFGRMYNAQEEPIDRLCWSSKGMFQRFEDDLPQYSYLLLERYASLRKTFFDISNLKQRFANYFTLFKQTGVDRREEERWSGVDNIELNFSDEEEYIYSWLEERLAYTDSLFNYTMPSSLDDNMYPSVHTTKVVVDNHILILRGDKMFTLQGQIIRKN